ncbi:MAG: hypothetical protein KDI53_07095, partial [Candidatus Accumulibacter sp.]|nr:hypothetical protein [Accumulibacter sp.]
MEEDTITDFERGQDRLDVAAFSASITDWAALSTRLSYLNNSARIDLGGGDLLILDNIPVDGLAESDFIGLGAGGERWTGSAGDDLHTGTPFNDALDGLAGNDTLDGGDGDDLVVGDSGGDVGGDVLRGGAGNDTLEGN